MQRSLTPPERLIVAADFKPNGSNGRDWVAEQVLGLANKLEGTGVYLKVNSALRACGYDLISAIHDRGLRVFADLKLYDISQTLATDAALLRQFKPELLTTVCSTGVDAMQALKAELPDTEVLGVTVLTSHSDTDAFAVYGSTVEASVLLLAELAAKADLDGLICSSKEVEFLRIRFREKMSLNAAGIRPFWAIVPGDDQNPERIDTPSKAIKAGADRTVVGRPITMAENPREAVLRTIEEISWATS